MAKGINSSVGDVPYEKWMTLMFGKFYGKKLEYAIEEDPEYILWAVNRGILKIDYEAQMKLKFEWEFKTGKTMVIGDR
jgi:hypothetical protein